MISIEGGTFTMGKVQETMLCMIGTTLQINNTFNLSLWMKQKLPTNVF